MTLKLEAMTPIPTSQEHGRTSSAGTALLKRPKDVWELGCHLVRELGNEEASDTLGIWMSHHLAELMHASEHASSVEERNDARASAESLILRIWERRATVSGNAHPLSRHEDLVRALSALDGYYGPLTEEVPDGATASQLADALKEMARRLDLWALLSASPDLPAEEHPSSAILDETEAALIVVLRRARGRRREGDGEVSDAERSEAMALLEAMDKLLCRMREVIEK